MAFFRALRGKTDPRAELEATLRGLLRRPARSRTSSPTPSAASRRGFAFLAGRLGADLARLPPRRCPRFEAFLDRMPAALGHGRLLVLLPQQPVLGLRPHLPAAQQGRRGARAARSGSSSTTASTTRRRSTPATPSLYAVKGLLGFFKGEFRNVAYYYKVREYADAESRDPVGVRPRALARRGGDARRAPVGARRDLLRLLVPRPRTAATTSSARSRRRRPGSTLLEHLGRNVVIPADTVKALFANPGLVRGVSWRAVDPDPVPRPHRPARRAGPRRGRGPRGGRGGAAPRGARQGRAGRGPRRRPRPPRPALQPRPRHRQDAGGRPGPPDAPRAPERPRRLAPPRPRPAARARPRPRPRLGPDGGGRRLVEPGRAARRRRLSPRASTTSAIRPTATRRTRRIEFLPAPAPPRAEGGAGRGGRAVARPDRVAERPLAVRAAALAGGSASARPPSGTRAARRASPGRASSAPGSRSPSARSTSTAGPTSRSRPRRTSRGPPAARCASGSARAASCGCG